MILLKKIPAISLPLFFARFRKFYYWRYWPMELLYLPLTLYVLFIGSICTRRLFYFAATNPKVPLGGFAADSKAEILNAIPLNFKHRTILVEKNTSIGDVLLLLEQRKCSFPLFVQPNIGESGFLAKKLRTSKN